MSLAACSEAWGVCENAGNSRSKTRGRAMLPTSREVEVNVSARHMYLYSREVRGVVARLRAECGSLSVHAVALAHTQDVQSGGSENNNKNTIQKHHRKGGSGITPQPLTWGRGGNSASQRSRFSL
ncbi:uncharacterized protein LOC144938296 [Lampetra fluviatilis]